MSRFEFPLTDTDKKVIRQWHELATVESLHRGDGAVTFPDEAVILKVLSGGSPYQFNEMQIKTVLSWAEQVFNKSYGGGDIRTPEEDRVYTLFYKALKGEDPPAASPPFPPSSPAAEEDLDRLTRTKRSIPWGTIALIVMGIAFMAIMVKMKAARKARVLPRAAPEQVADHFQTTLVKGTVLVKHKDSQTWDTLALNQKVFVPDTIKTDSASRAEFLTPKGYSLTVPANVTYVIYK